MATMIYCLGGASCENWNAKNIDIVFLTGGQTNRLKAQPLFKD